MGAPGGVVRFGEFDFDPLTRQLRRRGEEIHLSPKAFELLQTLISERPRAMSKAALQARLWPDSFVSEANLPGLVKEIRRALNDDPREPRFVRTLHGFGYAFAADPDTGPEGRAERSAERTFWIVGDRQIRLSPGASILGRDPDASVWFDVPGVSRRHARIVVSAAEATLEDLGSRNGTLLRGEPIAGPTPLRDGDEIRLGPVSLTFRARLVARSTEAL